MLGHFNFSEIEDVIELNAHKYEESIEAYRHAVNTIDDEVEQLIHLITQNRKLPIVIGGGHNNAYPCIKGAAKGWYKAGILEIAQINAINLDAHADYRAMEGRHSGNAFRYAEEDGYLEKYCVVGIHENYKWHPRYHSTDNRKESKYRSQQSPYRPLLHTKYEISQCTYHSLYDRDDRNPQCICFYHLLCFRSKQIDVLWF